MRKVLQAPEDPDLLPRRLIDKAPHVMVALLLPRPIVIDTCQSCQETLFTHETLSDFVGFQIAGRNVDQGDSQRCRDHSVRKGHNA